VPELVPPGPAYQWSFLAAVKETIEAGGDTWEAGLGVLGPLGDFPGEAYRLDELEDEDRFARFTDRLRRIADPAAELPAGFVHSTQLWWVDGDEYLGRISVRHRLTEWLLEFGGHIGYGVRPSARRRGHATAMLRACLPVAHRLGIDPALVTCDDTNVASRRVIEAAGGVFEDQRGEKLRYWVPTFGR
jgi:predicted acetyltransferase